MQTTIGQILVNDILPEEMRDYSRSLTSPAMKKLFQLLAIKYPAKYKQIAYKLEELGDKVAYEKGLSVRLQDLESPVDRGQLFSELDKELAGVTNKNQRAEILMRATERLREGVSREGLKKGNLLARMVASQARGNKNSLSQMIGAPVLVSDFKQRPILVPLKKSYAEGLDPADYWAASYGVRQGAVSTALSSSETGFFNKQLSLAASPLIVTEKDCETHQGVVRDVSDRDNLDTFLAQSVGDAKRGELVTSEILDRLRDAGIKKIMVRSPLTCEAEKGVCQMDMGITEKNTLPALGTNVGLISASAITEPISQGGLSLKHTGGAVQKQHPLAEGGFKLLQRLVNIPKVFKAKATLAEEDGVVSLLEPAPQGGTFITIGARKHYILPDLEPAVTLGQTVEQGDVLSEGIPNPAEIVRFKGLGAGRKYLADTLRATTQSQGLNVNRKNFEVVARALLNHVRIDDPEEMGKIQDDIEDYQEIQKEYRPVDAKERPLETAGGTFLASPYLHYSLGTRVTPSVQKELQEMGIPSVNTVDRPLPFSPVMLRVGDVPKFYPDWEHKLLSSELQRSLLKSLHRGEKSTVHGQSFVPAVAYGAELGKTKKVGY